LNDLYSSEYWLRLALTSGLGCRSQIALLHHFGSPGAVLAARSAELRLVLRDAQASAVQTSADRQDWPELANHLQWLDQPSNHLITLGDAAYPARLLDLPDPPVVLFAKGRLDLLTAPSLAIVGSRQATPQGLENA